ncbi:SLC8A1 isoform 1, partial [Pongo abelii]
KTISVKVIDDEEYEKNKTFFLEIGEPRLVEMSEKKGRSLPLEYLTVRNMRKSAVSPLCLRNQNG